jgi:hypothetical protein
VIRLGAMLAALALAACADPDVARLDAAEPLLADYLDAAGAVDLLDSGVRPDFDGASLETWRARYTQSEAALRAAVENIEEEGFSERDRRRFASMQGALALRAADASRAPVCADAADRSLSGPALRASLYVCFDEAADAITYGGARIGRLPALGLLETEQGSRERRAVFEAMMPLYAAVHFGDAESPYRRIVQLDNARMRANVDAALQTIGLDAAEGEAWLVRALEAWSRTLPYERAEAWDFRHLMRGGADASLARCSSEAAQVEANARFYRDLGADLGELGVIVDTQSSAPVAYADFVRIGRDVNGEWRPAVPWTTLTMEAGGPDAAALLVHEVGHTAHYAAMRARPSLTLPDDLSLLLEATADITAWSVWEPMWQSKYAGCAYPAAASLRVKLAPIMMDMAWGLFEMRMARAPESEPNVVWGEIAERYFRVIRRDDVAWWAVRGQLVEEPGYMVNYALGAFVTADLRAHIRDEIGNFDAGNARWYDYVSRNLYVRGGEDPPRRLLRDFLGRDVTPDAFLAELQRLDRRSLP